MPSSFPAARAGFVRAYAAFLAAAHRSFDQAPHRPPAPWQLVERLTRRKPWRQVLRAALDSTTEENGAILEFGVYKGASARFLAALRPGTPLHGFDSFCGFPDDQRSDWQLDFAVPKLPRVPVGVTLHQGYFEKTLPPFIANWKGQRPPLSLIHIDCDIFSSAHFVLSELCPWLKPGDLLVFDELMNYDGFVRNEFLALFLFLLRHDLDFEWLVTYGKPYPWLAQDGEMISGGFKVYRHAGYFQNQAIRLCPRQRGRHFAGAVPGAALLARLDAELAPLLDAQAIPQDLLDKAADCQ